MDLLKVFTGYSGVGSPEQALKNLKLKHRVIGTVEYDKYARTTYLANHTTERMEHDMGDVDFSTFEQSDLAIFGFPCQSFSIAGKRKGFDDVRGTQFFNVAEFIKVNQPEAFILENVKGLLSHDGGRTMQTIVDVLSNGGGTVNGQMSLDMFEDGLGYHIYYKVLNTKEHGIPQNRERIFIVGFKEPRDYRFPKEETLELRLKDVLETEVDEKYYLSDNNIEKLIAYDKKSKEKGNGLGTKFHEPETDIMSSLKVGGGGCDDLVKIKSATKRGYEEGNKICNQMIEEAGLPDKYLIKIDQDGE